MPKYLSAQMPRFEGANADNHIFTPGLLDFRALGLFGRCDGKQNG